MIYNSVTSGLTTVQECDRRIADQQKEKSSLELRKLNLQALYDRTSETSDLTESSLEQVEQEIANLQGEIAGMPEGRDRLEKERELSNANSRRLTLLLRQTNNNPEITCDRFHDLRNLDREIEEKTIYLTELEARKLELEAV